MRKLPPEPCNTLISIKGAERKQAPSTEIKVSSSKKQSCQRYCKKLTLPVKPSVVLTKAQPNGVPKPHAVLSRSCAHQQRFVLLVLQAVLLLQR